MTRNGAQKYPYGLPSLGRAADQGEELLILEGPVDALGAETFERRAIATLKRPEAGEIHQAQGATERAMNELMPSLRRCSRIRVLPDNDPGGGGVRGIVAAANLAQWLAARNLDADVVTMQELGLGAFNDLGEAAERTSRERAAEAQAEIDRREVPPGVSRQDWEAIKDKPVFKKVEELFGPFQTITIHKTGESS